VGVVVSSVVCALVQTYRASGQEPVVSDDDRLKAAFTLHLPQFVEWPEAALARRSSLEFCVPRANPLGAAIETAATGETFLGKPIAVREIDADEPIGSCHILFVSTRPTAGLDHLLFRASSLPILTVGEAPRFLDNRGIIRLRMIDGRVRFDVNAAAADRVGLRLSSQLLRLALEVRMGLP
jgi:hypothetical protein